MVKEAGSCSSRRLLCGGPRQGGASSDAVAAALRTDWGVYHPLVCRSGPWDTSLGLVKFTSLRHRDTRAHTRPDISFFPIFPAGIGLVSADY